MRPYDHAPVVHCSSIAKSDARSNRKDIGPRHSSLSRGEKHRTSMEAQDCRPRVLSRRKNPSMKRFDRCRVVFRHAGARSFLGTASGYRLMPDSNLRTCAVVPGRSGLSGFQKSWPSQVGGQSCDVRHAQARRTSQKRGNAEPLESGSTPERGRCRTF